MQTSVFAAESKRIYAAQDVRKFVRQPSEAIETAALGLGQIIILNYAFAMAVLAGLLCIILECLTCWLLTMDLCVLACFVE